MKNQHSLPMCTLLAVSILCISLKTGAAAQEVKEVNSPGKSASVIVVPKFGGQILGYGIDANGTEGLLSEFVNLPNGNVLAATETFDQATGKILDIISKTETQADTDTQGVFGTLGLVLSQQNGANRYFTIKPLQSNKFNGSWTPPIMPQYQLWTMSRDLQSPNVAAYQSSFDTGLTFVFSSNIANNTFGPQISLQPIINVNEFFHPAIALDNATNQAVLADSQGCPEPTCVMSVALVNLTSGAIDEFTDNLGVGTVNGVAVDSSKGLAVTTTLIDQGVEFYHLAKQSGFEVIIPNADSAANAGLDVEFDPLHSLFLVAQYTTNNPDNPTPAIYVYNEAGEVTETITGLQPIPISPSPIALNPSKRTGFVPVILAPQNLFLELQSFSY